MEPLSLTLSIITILQVSGAVVVALYDYRAGVKHASKDAAQIIAEINGLRAVLESLLHTVEEETDKERSSRLATFDKLLGPNSEVERCKASFESISAKLGIHEKGSAWGSMKRALAWPFKKEDIEKILENVQRAKSTIQLALTADQTAMTLEIHESVNTLTLRSTAEALERRKKDILIWLNAPNYYVNHAAARKKHQPRTGDWFLSRKPYLAWKEQPSSLFWLHGIPGAGKSVLCSSIIEDLIFECEQSVERSLAYYYFDFNDIGKRDVETLVRALIAQMLSKILPTSECVVRIYSEISQSNPSLEVLSGILFELMREFEQAFIVIDALDECSELENLISWLEKVSIRRPSCLHILTTSRLLSEIQELMSLNAASSICLHDYLNQDIRLHVEERLRSDRKFQRWPEAVQLEIEAAVMERSAGMFRWVVCQLEMLRRCPTLADLRTALETLPKTLDETYERILLKIDENYTAHVQKILQYLAFAIRPPTLEEMVEILAIKMSNGELHIDPNNRISDARDILSMCSSLVTTSDYLRNSDGDGYKGTEQTIRLAHFSVKEYLLSDRIKRSEASSFALDSISSNLYIAKLYLAYLLSSSLSPSNYDSITGTVTSNQSNPMFRSAIFSWAKHIEMVGDDCDSEAISLIRKLFDSRHEPMGGNYAVWLSAHFDNAIFPAYGMETALKTPPLYYAASYSMTPIVRLLISITPKKDIDLKGGRVMATPLHVACYRGKTEVVKVLLEAGADPNSTNCIGESCLYWASRRRDYLEGRQVRDLLLRHGAVNRRTQGEGLQSWAEVHETITPAEMLDNQHYTKEYYRLAKTDLSGDD